MTELRHARETYELRGLIFQAHNELKAGWSEEVYHQALHSLLRDNEVPVASNPRKSIFHREHEIHTFECDLIVWDRIILELKALPSTTFTAAHYAQIFSYLKCWSKDLGLLVNFGVSHADIKRVVWNEQTLAICENYDSLKSELTQSDRTCLRRIRRDLLAVAKQYGLGYPETVYRKIVAVEMQYNGLDCQCNVDVPAKWDGKILTRHASDHLLVENKYLVSVCALLEQPAKYEFIRTKTFLNHLGLRFGLVVNFGKKQFQIYGVNPE